MSGHCYPSNPQAGAQHGAIIAIPTGVRRGRVKDPAAYRRYVDTPTDVFIPVADVYGNQLTHCVCVVFQSKDAAESAFVPIRTFVPNTN